ncbi:hypothetical protein GCM10023175_19470 [Pseudonocardia xishanensis]|uniref:Uncharacterized protein n=1 Tax=Pseudonocardia xishanensis TaxID=630995 RepID=A0ABP8RMT7_9PSEU
MEPDPLSFAAPQPARKRAPVAATPTAATRARLGRMVFTAASSVVRVRPSVALRPVRPFGEDAKRAWWTPDPRKMNAK